MAKIIHKKSSVAGKIPAISDLEFGELALNYADGKLFYKDSNNAVQSFGGAALSNSTRQQFTATANQTTFNITYTPGQVDVYLNGIKLLVGIDFTATNGSNIVLTTGADAGDIVDIVAGTIFASADWQYVTNKPTTISGFGIVDAQPLDADLTAISAVSGNTGFLRKIAADTWQLDTNTYLTSNQNIVFSGDVSGNGTTNISLTLANSGVTAGLYGSTTNIPQITVDAKGRVTNVTNVAVSIPSGSLTFTGDVTGTGSTGSSTALTLANSGVTAGTYTKVTVDAKGRTTSATTLSASDIPNLDASKITSGTIDAARLPSYVDDVLEYANLAGFPASGESGKIYVAIDTNKVYRWSGSVYVEISPAPDLSGYLPLSGGTLTGNLNFSGTSLRITGDFSSLTTGVMFQTSTANSATRVVTLPNGTGTLSGFRAYNSSDVNNASIINVNVSSTAANIGTGYSGTGAQLPLNINMGATTAVAITTAGVANFPVGLQQGGNTVLTTANYNSYALPLSGGTLTGNITVSSTSVGAQFGNLSVGYGGYFNTLQTKDGTSDLHLNYTSTGNINLGVGGGYTTINQSTRSPIYYDSDNTGYYIDAASLSTLNRLLVTGGDSTNPTLNLQASVYPMLDFTSTSTDGNNRNWRLAGVFNSYGLFQILSSTAANGTPTTARLGISGGSGYVGIGAAATGPANWLQIGSVGSTGYGGNHIAIGDGTYAYAEYLNGSSYMAYYTTSGYFYFANQYLQAAGSMRAPIFYDSNDTNYYVDPNSYSRINTIALGSAGSLIGSSNSYPLSVYHGTRYLMGFRNSGSGTSNYPWLVHDNWNGDAVIFHFNGIGDRFRFSSGGIGQADSDFRAPIFYDSDNTSYYIDPNSSSRLVNLGLGGVTPDVRLSVSGDGHFSNYLYLGGTAGSAGSWSARMISSGGATYLQTNTFEVNRTGYGGNAVLWTDTGENVYSNASHRAPIFYDRDNTGYYIDAASTSVLNQLTVDGDPVYTTTQSNSDFVNGTLVQTDISSSGWAGDSFRLEATGKSYGAGVPFMFLAEGYLYNDTIINVSGIHLGHVGFSTLKVFSNNGLLAFWWPRVGYWNSFEVRVTTANGTGGNVNRITSITDVAEPSGGTVTKKVNISMASYMRTDISATNADTIRSTNFRASNAYYLGENNWFLNNTNGGWYSNVRIQSADDMRGTVFYDNNDTGYYIDPNSTSNSALRMRGGALFGPNPTWGAYLGVGTNGHAGSSYGSIAVTNGNLHMDAAAGYEMYLNYYAGTNVYYAYGSSIRGGFYTDSSVRASLFYDFNNTSYYTDPASTSVLNTVQFASGVYIQSASTAGDRNLKVRGTTSSDVGITGHDASDNWRFQLYASSGNYGFLNGLWGGWDLQKSISGNLYMNNNTSYYLNAPSDNYLYRVYGAADIRSPIFYDSNDTNYYLDPNGNSLIGGLRINKSWSGGPVGPEQFTITGSYPSMTFRNSSADNKWLLHHDGSNIQFYYGGTWNNDAWSRYAQISTVDIHHVSSLRAPIFYDYNDTGYYLDPTSTTSLRTVGDWRADSSSWTGEFAGKMQYHSNNWYIQFTSNVLFRNSGGTNVLTCDSSGNLTANGNVTAYSDIRLKENIYTIDGALSKVLNLRGVYYNKIGETQRKIGLVAQEAQQVIPEVVISVETVDPATGTTSDLLAVDYGNTVALLIEAVKEQQQTIQQQTSRIEKLEKLLEQLI